MSVEYRNAHYRDVLTDPVRLAKIHDLELVDTPAEEVFDRLTRLAARLIPSPIALISIVDNERQFFKSAFGLAEPLATHRQTPLSHAFCQHVVVSGQPFIVEDAREHDLVKDNPSVEELNVISYLGIPLVTKQGKVLGSFCAIDSKPRKWTDEDIETVRELTRSAMTEIELRQELKSLRESEIERASLLEKLERTNQDLTDFAYIVSHDLKAPLRGIGSIADWLSTDYADLLDEDGQELLDLMQRRVSRLQDFIEGILRYSRVGRFEEQWENVDLNPLISEIVTSLSPPTHIQIKVDNQLPVVYGGRVRLEQLFQNLISNAIKFMDKPNGEIVISSSRQNGHWAFQVADNGPGIEEHHFGKIFQIFQTLTPRDDFESTGIGLTLVKKIIEIHDGSIEVESTPGSGATFKFKIPVNGAPDNE